MDRHEITAVPFSVKESLDLGVYNSSIDFYSDWQEPGHEGTVRRSEAKPLGTDGPVKVGRSLRDSAGQEESQFVDISDDGSGLDEVVPISDQTQGMLRKIEVSREMMAVIVEVLIKNGGRMTQTDMRYETSTPKSSLTMALISLEKRKLVTRREWGRTYVVEISERFLSGKDRS